jgi:hypothetical protein
MSTPIRTSTPAILSLVFGLACWFVLPLLGAIVAVVCGHVARSEIRQAATGTVDGERMAFAGMILGYVQLALGFLIMLTLVGAFFGIMSGGHHF